MTDDESVSAVERERMQRMAACWRESRPSGTAISSARRRFVRATAVTTVTFASLCASFAYGTVGALIVVGGGHVASTWTARGQGHRIEEAQLARAESAASTRHEAMRESATPIETPNGVVAPLESATDAPLPNAVTLDPAPMRAMQRAAASVPQVPPTPPARVNASAAVGDAEIAAPPHAEASAWQRAAAALERHDSVAADQALGELTTQPDARTRDAAWLARAELWASQGTPERATPILEKLAASGSTAIIRKRAQDLLREGKGAVTP